MGFKLYNDEGMLLWQEAPYPDPYDTPGRLYRVSSKGVVCKVNRASGTALFYSRQGNLIGEHVIVPGMSRTMDGVWSPDGDYFLISAHTGYDDIIFLIEDTGKKVWEQRIKQKWAVEVKISPTSKWTFVRYNDFSTRNFGALIISTIDGTISQDFNNEDLIRPEFSHDGKLLLVKSRLSENLYGQRLILLDLESRNKRFETILRDRILDYKLWADDNLIYVVHRTELLAMDLNGGIMKKIDLNSLAPSSSIKDAIHPASSANFLLLRTQQTISLFYVK